MPLSFLSSFVLFAFGEGVGTLGIEETALFGPEVGVVGLALNFIFAAMLFRWWKVHGRTPDRQFEELSRADPWPCLAATPGQAARIRGEHKVAFPRPTGSYSRRTTPFCQA